MVFQTGLRDFPQSFSAFSVLKNRSGQFLWSEWKI